jgi:PKD repeat protein
MRRVLAFALVLVTVISAVSLATRAEMIPSVHSIGSPFTDYLNAMKVDSQGNVYLAGGLQVESGVYRYLSCLAKFSKNGTLGWVRTFTSGVDSALYNVEISPTGDIFALGSSDVSTFLLKLSPAGDVIWAKDISIVSTASSSALAFDQLTNSVVVMGGGYDGCVMALDSDGNVRWTAHADSYLHEPWSMVTDSSGSSYVLVHCWDTNDIGIVELNGLGDIVARAILNTTDVAEWANHIQFTADGGLVCSGTAQYDDTMVVAEVTSDLKGVWAEYIGNSDGYNEPYRIATPANGSIYILAPGEAPDRRLDLLFQLDPNGNILEAAEWPEQDFWPEEIACVPSGGLAVAGTLTGLPPNELKPYTNYTVSAIPASNWISSSGTWNKTTEMSFDADIVVNDPNLPVDLFDNDLMEQFFYCIIEAQSPVSVDISEEFVIEGDTLVNLTASASGGTPPYNYTWSFGDNSLGYDSAFVAHKYPAPGVYYAQVYVEDCLGASASNSTIAIVYGPPTVGSISYSPMPNYMPIIEGIPLSISVIAEDPDGGSLMYFWDYGDGNSTVNTTGDVIHAYGFQGNYTVNLTVVDDEGDSNSTSVSIKVNVNVPPWAYVYYWPNYPHPGQTMDFYEYSGDSDDWVESYLWDFGDNTSGTGYYASHAYTDEGVYNVTLIVTDTGGKTGSYSVLVTVKENWPPVPDFWITPWPPSANASVTYDAHQSRDPDGTITAFDWDFGDGCAGVGMYTTHTYAMGGYYNVTLMVTDDRGANANLTMLTYVNFDPVATFFFEPSEPLQQQTFVFNGSGSYDTDGTIASCIWSFGDGGTWYSYDLVINYSYWKGGDYIVNLTVIDNNGGRNTAWRWIHVNWMPVVDAGPDQLITVGQEVVFNGSASSGNGAILSYTWEFFYNGQLIVLNGSSPNFTFLIPGVYNITLTVTDEKGINATDQFAVIVTDVIPEFSMTLAVVCVLATILVLLVAPRRKHLG